MPLGSRSAFLTTNRQYVLLVERSATISLHLTLKHTRFQAKEYGATDMRLDRQRSFVWKERSESPSHRSLADARKEPERAGSRDYKATNFSA